MENLDQLELIPGFHIIESLPGCTTLDIPSGYRIKVRRMGPNLQDLMSDGEWTDPGPFKIKVRYLEKSKPPGIEVERVYGPPTDADGKPKEPDYEQFEQEWVYFQQWKDHERVRREYTIKRGILQFNMALANCVDVVSGPVDIASSEWFDLLDDVGANLSSKLGERKLAFLKSQVISTETIRDVILFLMRVEEVTIEGLKQAFDSFWGRMARTKALIDSGLFA